MARIINDASDIVNKNESLIDIWGRRNPKFERKYEDSVMRALSEYGIKANQMTSSRAKIFGNGYEPYIIAFFIGLYSNKKLPLSDDTKVLGYPIQYWGNVESRNLRKAYPELRNFIFISLVAKTDIDWIALDKGDIEASTVVSCLVKTMEEYANYGFSMMEEKLKEDSGYFYSHRAFLDLFMQLTNKAMDNNGDDVEEL